MKHERIFEYLQRRATEADWVQNSKHCAAVVYKGKIISIGFNKERTHPLGVKYQSKPERMYIHAEIDAINNASFIPKGANLYVTRISKGGCSHSSKPCEGCQKMISDFGIKKVYHT